jgi:membrane protein YdbS with pleckstrin-like domain
LARYLLDGERIVTAVHQHWAKVAAPVASVVAGLVLVLALDSFLPAALGLVANLLWWAWFVLVGRAVWKVLERQHDWFVATDKRLILTYGLITHKVAMMPLAKVTDMTYNRSPMGRLLGYGTFVMESAGQDQALRRVGWVADPDHTYRAICAEIFGVEDHERVRGEDEHDSRFGGDPPSHSPLPGGTSRLRGNAGYVPLGGHPGSPGPDTTDYSTAIPIRPASPTPDASDPGESSIHEADTGPIHY